MSMSSASRPVRLWSRPRRGTRSFKSTTRPSADAASLPRARRRRPRPPVGPSICTCARFWRSPSTPRARTRNPCGFSWNARRKRSGGTPSSRGRTTPGRRCAAAPTRATMAWSTWSCLTSRGPRCHGPSPPGSPAPRCTRGASSRARRQSSSTRAPASSTRTNTPSTSLEAGTHRRARSTSTIPSPTLSRGKRVCREGRCQSTVAQKPRQTPQLLAGTQRCGSKG
mmetsp:Transcript_7137/g.18236  ORF Transcript_7137/g.18236 Transcript_7137/m.18236 type:complete len:225 (-) Transcript_7137:177-851(-)